jgi:hypothetical protein
MNPREKKLVAIVGVLLALMLSWTVKSWYVGKLASLQTGYDNAVRDREKAHFEQRRLKQGKEAWAEAGRQTIADTDNEAQTLFRPDVDQLVQEVGLTNSKVELKGMSKIGANGLRYLNCNLIADGSLDKILKLLFKLRQRPYVVRFQMVRLSRPNDSKLPKEILRLTADIDTLLLPDAKSCDLPKVASVNLASQPARTVVRQKYPKLEDYGDIVTKKIFERWEPPIPPPDKVAGHNPGRDGRHVFNKELTWASATRAQSYEVYFGESKPPLKVNSGPATSYRPPQPLTVGKTYYWKVNSVSPQGTTEGEVLSFTAVEAPKEVIVEGPPPEPPPLYENLLLTRIVSSPRGQQAVLEDPANKTAEDKRIEVGEPFYKGTLVLIHPKGAVSEDKKDGQLRFHPLTKALRESVPLTEQTQPLVWDAALKLEKRSTGISQRPG